MNYRKGIFYYTLVLIVLAAFVYISQAEQDVQTLFSVHIMSDGDEETICSWKNEEGTNYVFLPSYADLSETRIYTHTESPLSINGLELTEGMLCNSFRLNTPYILNYRVWGREKYETIIFIQSAAMPSMYIDTQSGSMNYIHQKKKNKESGVIRLYEDTGILAYSGSLESLQGRGNYSWSDYSKKPYSLNLAEEVDLLGMGTASRWILLANASDHSNMRNKIAFDLADAVGMNYTPDSRWVELYLNGNYVGLYLLCERIEVHPERTDISVDNSFLIALEMESRLKSQRYSYVTMDSGQALRVFYPQNADSVTMEKVREDMQSVENAILAEDGIDLATGKLWLEKIDLDSWVQKYLLEEILGNLDAGFISQYFYKDGNDNLERIYAGPAWDYDHTLGNPQVWELTAPHGLFAGRPQVSENDYTPWYANLYKQKLFYERIIELYQTNYLPQLNILLSTGLEQYVSQIGQAVVLDQLRWGYTDSDLSNQTECIRDYLQKRIEFLSNIWLHNASYHQVVAVGGPGGHYAYYTVLVGEPLMELPCFEDTETRKFMGWYDEKTGEPVNSGSPVEEDMIIHAKWQEKSSKWPDRIEKMVPLCAFGVIFMVVLLEDRKRTK